MPERTKKKRTDVNKMFIVPIYQREYCKEIKKCDKNRYKYNMMFDQKSNPRPA
jgi:hypothetical protein